MGCEEKVGRTETSPVNHSTLLPVFPRGLYKGVRNVPMWTENTHTRAHTHTHFSHI